MTGRRCWAGPDTCGGPSHTIPAPARCTLFHQGRGEMLDHMLITRNLLAYYRGSEIHNALPHDESAAFAIDRKYPESDHAPSSRPSTSPPDGAGRGRVESP